MTPIAFVVPGRPQPKQRARKGAKGRWYTPQETLDYERRVRMASFVAARRAGLECSLRGGTASIDGPVSVELAIYVPDRRTRDADNVTKSILDGLQGRRGTLERAGMWGLLVNDEQVVDLHVTKAVDKANPRVEVIVRAVNGGSQS